MAGVAVHLEQVRKAFGSTVAVRDITLPIAAGELFFLLGPSGCGKTTLLRMIAGFSEPTSGRIRFGTRDVTTLPANKRNTGMVFQGYALWPHMSVRQNVAFGLGVRKVAAAEQRQRVDAALERVELAHLADRKPNQLSGGQQQRVALARALVIEPDVLLLDEPLSNLDAKLRLEMRQQIRDVCKAVGITGIYVTHDQSEALSMADRIAVLSAGEAVQVGPPQELYRRPRNKFVADFLGQTNFIPAQVVGQRGGELELTCTAGRLISRVFPVDLAKDQAVTCSVRPEAVRVLHEAESGTVNTFTGRVQRSVYLGESAQHEVALSEGVSMHVVELNPRVSAPEPTLRVKFDADDVVVLRD